MKMTAWIPGTGENRTDLIHNELFDLSGGFLGEWLKKTCIYFTLLETHQELKLLPR